MIPRSRFSYVNDGNTVRRSPVTKIMVALSALALCLGVGAAVIWAIARNAA